VNPRDEDRVIQERLRSYRPPECPPGVVDLILARIDAEERDFRRRQGKGSRGLAWWSRLLVPAAALGLMVILLGPGKWLRGNNSTVEPAPGGVVAQGDDSVDPCARELEEIFRRLGVDRSQVRYDDATICAAAQEVRLAWTLMEQAMDSTERVIGRETRGRFTRVLRNGLGEKPRSSAKSADPNPRDGG